MGKAGFSKKPRVYVPKSRKKEENPPKFSVRRLDPLEVFDVLETFGLTEDSFDEAGAPKKGKVSVSRSLKVAFEYLSMGLTGWENVTDENGEEIPFNKENIRCLDIDIVMELSAVIQGNVSEEEAKNSETPS